MTQRHAEIAGAGFAGLTAATALALRGWSVRIHEVSAAPRAYGAGIFLWENGLTVLREIGAYDDVMTNAHEASRMDDFDADGELMFSRPLPIPQGSRLVTMARQDLYAPVLKAARDAGVDIVTDSMAVSASPEGELILADKRRLKADLVIAADGLRSMIRTSLSMEKEHLVFPIGIFRTLVERSSEELADDKWNSYINFWNEGRRVLYVPCNSKDLYVLLGAKIPDPEALSRPFAPDEWTRSFPGLASIFSRIGPADLRFDQYEVMRCRAWSTGRVALIGDAAHGMPPTMGQGAGSGMMNAWKLASALDRFETIEEALSAWEAEERPTTEHTQAISVGRTFEWPPRKESKSASWTADDAKPALHMMQGR